MMIKICGITNAGDALAAAGEGASALGFNFHPPSPRYIRPEDAASICRLLPSGVCKVGVFVNLPAGRVAEIVGTAGLDVAQLHGAETAADAPPGLRVWKAWRAGAFDPSEIGRFPAEAFLIDGGSGGEGVVFDWAVARGLPGKIILAGGLDGDNVGEAIRVARPWGVDSCSRLESAPGRKDRAKVAGFIRAALAGSRS